MGHVIDVPPVFMVPAPLGLEGLLSEGSHPVLYSPIPNQAILCMSKANQLLCSSREAFKGGHRLVVSPACHLHFGLGAKGTNEKELLSMLVRWGAAGTTRDCVVDSDLGHIAGARLLGSSVVTNGCHCE